MHVAPLAGARIEMCPGMRRSFYQVSPLSQGRELKLYIRCFRVAVTGRPSRRGEN